MLDQSSVAAVAGALDGDRTVRHTLSGRFSVDAVPATVTSLLTAGPRTELADRVAGLGVPCRDLLLVILDGFGWSQLEEFAADSALLRRMIGDGVVCKILAQFPTTTASNITTLHSGLPVGSSGLVEWLFYEPAVDALISPLMFSYAGDRTRDTLLAAVGEPREILPLPSLYRALTDRGVDCVVHQSAAFIPSTYSSVVLDGARLVPFADPAEAVGNISRCGPAVRPRYSVLYLNQADSVAHVHGPSSDRYRETATGLLRLLEDVFTALVPGTVLALTADHGHVDVDTSRTVYLNHVWPGLEPFLRHWSTGPAVGPGGSPRDCLLYLADRRDIEEVTARLGEQLAGVADVVPTASLAERGLFGPRPTDRLLDRAGDVAVLPVRGQTVWWFDPVSFRNTYRGRHGGLTEEEAVVPFAAIVR